MNYWRQGSLVWLASVGLALFLLWPGLSAPAYLDSQILSSDANLTNLPKTRFITYTSLFFGSSLTWHRIVNLILHLLNCILVGEVCFPREPNSRPFKTLLILILMVHPVSVAPVLYVVQRAELLTTFFSLILLYRVCALPTSLPNSLILALLWLCAFTSKETALILPLLALAFSQLDPATEPPGFSRAKTLLTVLILASAAWFYAPFFFNSVETAGGFTLSPSLSLMQKPYFVLQSIWSSLTGEPVLLEYGLKTASVTNLSSTNLCLETFFTVALLFGLGWLVKTKQVGAGPMLAGVLTLVPSLGLITLADPIALHRSYFFHLLIWGAIAQLTQHGCQLSSQSNLELAPVKNAFAHRIPVAFLALSFLLITFFCWRTAAYAKRYSSPRQFWAFNLKRAPDSYRANYYFFLHSWQDRNNDPNTLPQLAKQIEQAANQFPKPTELLSLGANVRTAIARSWRGRAKQAKSNTELNHAAENMIVNYDIAQNLLKRGLKRDSQNVTMLLSLARLLTFDLNDPNSAQPYFERCVTLKPNSAMAWWQSALCQRKLGHTRRFREQLQRAQSLADPKLKNLIRSSIQGPTPPK